MSIRALANKQKKGPVLMGFKYEAAKIMQNISNLLHKTDSRLFLCINKVVDQNKIHKRRKTQLNTFKAVTKRCETAGDLAGCRPVWLMKEGKEALIEFKILWIFISVIQPKDVWVCYMKETSPQRSSQKCTKHHYNHK